MLAYLIMAAFVQHSSLHNEFPYASLLTGQPCLAGRNSDMKTVEEALGWIRTRSDSGLRHQ